MNIHSLKAPIVSVQELSHRYTRDWAVQNVSFDIRKAGIIGLLGSNGAGKSTCMNVMCGVLNPTEGDVLIDGQSIREEPLAAKGRIGFLPQQVPIYPELTVREYLTYCAELRDMEPVKIRAAVDAVMERCGVAHFAKRLISALSGGYRQRCGIAQSILHSPSLVVLDEPTNGLDPVQVLELRKLIKEVAAERTVLLSTHILPEVEALCDDIKMIERGRMVFQGTLEEFSSVVEPRSLIAVFGNPPSSETLDGLAGIDGVESITAKKFRLHAARGADVSSTIIEASISDGWHLREIYFERSSLDAVFARLAEAHTA